MSTPADLPNSLPPMPLSLVIAFGLVVTRRWQSRARVPCRALWVGGRRLPRRGSPRNRYRRGSDLSDENENVFENWKNLHSRGPLRRLVPVHHPCVRPVLVPAAGGHTSTSISIVHIVVLLSLLCSKRLRRATGHRGQRVGEATNPGPQACPACRTPMALASRPRKCLECDPHKTTTFACGPCIASGVPASYCQVCCDTEGHPSTPAAAMPAGIPVGQEQPRQQQHQQQPPEQVQQRPQAEVAAASTSAPPNQPDPDRSDGPATPLAASSVPAGEQRSVGHRALCRCGSPLTGRNATVQDTSVLCHACGRHFAYRGWLYGCSACFLLTCKACNKQIARSQRGSSSLGAEAQALPPPPAAALPSPELAYPPAQNEPQQQELLELLRQLPHAYRRPALLWIPRAVRPQVASLLRQMLAAATRLAQQPQGSMDAEIAHLLLLHAPQLLLRQMPAKAEVQPRLAAGIVQEIRGRLVLARAGRWSDLVSALLDHLEEEGTDLLVGSQCTRPEAECSFETEDVLPEHFAQAVALKARTGSLRAAAAMLTGGPAVPAGPATDAAIRELFQTSELSDMEHVRLQAALAKARSAPPGQRPKITLRSVASQLASSRPAAGPGPSGWRNSHLHAIHSEADGPAAMSQWAQIWADGKVSPWIAELWTACLARPFFKDSGQCRKIRPVLCSEALYKFPLGCVLRTTEAQIARGCGPRQFAISRPDGARREIAEVRAAAQAYPDRAFVSLDVKNAFGEIAWAEALEAAAELAPSLGPAIAAAWAPGSVRVYTSTPCKDWHPFHIRGSLIQGNPEGSPLYCLVASRVRAALERHPDVAPFLADLKQWQYVDDWILHVPVAHLPALLSALAEVLEAFHLPLQREKCQVHVAAWATGVPEGAQLPQGFVHSADGLTLLGTSACRDQAMPLRQSVGIPAHTQDRLDRALRLARRAVALARAAPPAGGRQPAFAIARTIIAHALDFDAGVLPSRVLLPHAERLDLAVMEVIVASIGLQESGLTQLQQQQVYLPRRLGGLQVSRSSTLVPLARAAALMRHGPGLRDEIATWGLGDGSGVLRDPKEFDGVGADEGKDLLLLLSERGVGPLSGTGLPALGSPPASDPLRPLAPAAKLLSALLASAADSAFSKLFDALPAEDRVRLLSAGGASAGASLTAPLSHEGVHFCDWQWAEALGWRLGLQPPGPSGLCKNQKASGEACNLKLDGGQDHAMDCPCGPLRNRQHNEVAEVYADILEECGALCRMEVFVPEFSSSKEAWLDVWAYGIHGLPDLLLDITCRHPRASRYRPESELQPGAASAQSEREKQDRYPPAGGRSVWPIVYESWGRASAGAESLLLHLVAAARRRAHRRGRTGGHEISRWRARIDGVLQRGVVARLAAARHGLPGKRPYRQRPLDLSALEAGCPV